MAVAMRGELAEQVVLHADRGCQYTSAQLARFAREHNLVRSVGRTAVCWDNAQQESFWATLKVEFYDRYLWPTKAAAKLGVGDWIERVYNRRRRHSALAMMSPGRLRRPTHSDGTSRLTVCPPNGVKPIPVPARPSPPADLQKPSQRIPLRPTMFRTTCDNSVTTSAARQPTNSKPDHLEMPAGKPDLHQTRPGQPSPLPHHRAPAAHRKPSRQPVRHPHAPTPAGPAVSFHSATRDSRICRRPHSVPRPRHGPPARSRNIPMPADDGDQDRVIVVAPDSRLPGSPAID